MAKIVNFKNIGGEVVKQDDRYTVTDNKELSNLILSKTVLHYGKSTTGHSHAGQEEVYMFIEGFGKMQVADEQFLVCAGDIVLIPDGHFHRVFNDTKENETNSDLVFICVFDGKRNH